MKKEYTFLFICGLFLLAYVLDLAVKPLNLNLTTPYQFFQPNLLTQYPFTAASVIIKAIGLFLTPLWIASFIEGQYTLKGVLLLILAALMQLYALQDIVTKASVVPIEWSLSISLAGVALLVPMIIYFVRGALSSLHSQIAEAPKSEVWKKENEEKSNA